MLLADGFLRLFFLPLEFVGNWFALSVVIVVAAVIFTCVSLVIQKIKGE